MNTPVVSVARRLEALVRAVSTTRHGLIGLSVTRVAVGSIILVDLAIHAGQRQTLWGPLGWYDDARMQRDQQLGISLFNLGSGTGFTDLLYLLYAALAALFLVGWRTRVVTPLLLLLVWSFHERNPYLLNGGDNLVRIVLFYLMFARLDAYLAPGAGPRRAALARQPLTTRRVVATVAHNTALAASVAQLCVLYLGSAMFKIQGEMWQEGTAVYYITRVAEYNAWPELSAVLAQSAVAVTVATYAAVFVQLAFPFTLANRHTRHAVFVALVGMHAGIGLLMGLPVFSAFMIAVDLLVFTDAEWRRGLARARRLLEHAQDRLPARPPTPVPVRQATPVGVLERIGS